mgnify:CR=1 FL=1
MVGAYGTDTSRGSAYVFERDGSVTPVAWPLRDTLTAPVRVAGDSFGSG